MAEKPSEANMKNLLWMVGGVCAAAVGLLVWGPYKRRVVADLAGSLHTPHDSPVSSD